MRRRDFWDSKLEKRYADYKKDETRPSLKVVLTQLPVQSFLSNSPPLSHWLITLSVTQLNSSHAKREKRRVHFHFPFFYKRKLFSFNSPSEL